jgi:antagonist of KipI
MDRTAARVSNLLLQNDETDAVLEMHFPAGEFSFQDETIFAIGGADLSAELSGVPISNWRTIKARNGDVLRFAHRRSGNRAYLSVKGGFIVEPWLGSASTSLVTHTGGFLGRKLLCGDAVPFGSQAEPTNSDDIQIGPSLLPHYSSESRLRVTAGPELETLSGLSQIQLFSEKFKITPQSNRMGFRLNGPRLHKLSDDEMLSSGTTFGTIQLLPDGQLIVLMADHQTTGGYPRIATIASVDLPLIAQLGPNDAGSFELIDQADAEQLTATFEQNLNYLGMGVRVARGGL